MREVPWKNPREQCAFFGVEHHCAFPIEEQKSMGWCWCGWHTAIVKGPANAKALLEEHINGSS